MTEQYQTLCTGSDSRGGRMYQYLMGKYAECMAKARAQTDENMKRFYYNAAQGFKAKALRLTLENA